MVVMVEEDVCVGMGRGSLWAEVGASGVAIGYTPCLLFTTLTPKPLTCLLVPVSGVCPPRVPFPPLSMLHMQRVHACSAYPSHACKRGGLCAVPCNACAPRTPTCSGRGPCRTTACSVRGGVYPWNAIVVPGRGRCTAMETNF